MASEITLDKFLKQQRAKMFRKTQSGYVFDKLIFNVAMFSIFAFLFFIAYSNHFELDYFSCEAGPFETCKNPFYQAPTWKSEQYLPTGEYGTKPGLLFNWAGPISFSVLICAFILNHLIYNKGKIDFKGIIDEQVHGDKKDD